MSPYKSLEDKRKHDRDDKRTKRGTTSKDDTAGTTFEGKPRFVTLSDGQVFDRTYRPKPNKHLPRMIACNKTNKTDLSRGRSKARRIALISRALDRTMTGLDGKPVKLSSMVRYGVNGYTFDEINKL